MVDTVQAAIEYVEGDAQATPLVEEIMRLRKLAQRQYQPLRSVAPPRIDRDHEPCVTVDFTLFEATAVFQDVAAALAAERARIGWAPRTAGMDAFASKIERGSETRLRAYMRLSLALDDVFLECKRRFAQGGSDDSCADARGV